MENAPHTVNFFCCINVKKGSFIFSMLFFGYAVSDWVALLNDKEISTGHFTLWTVENTCLFVSAILLFIGSVKDSLPCLSLFLLFSGSELFLFVLEWFVIYEAQKGYIFEIVYEWFIQLCLLYLLIVVPFYMNAISNSKNISIALNEILTDELSMSSDI